MVWLRLISLSVERSAIGSRAGHVHTKMSTVAAPTRTAYQPIYTRASGKTSPRAPGGVRPPLETTPPCLLATFYVGCLTEGVAVYMARRHRKNGMYLPLARRGDRCLGLHPQPGHVLPSRAVAAGNRAAFRSCHRDHPVLAANRPRSTESATTRSRMVARDIPSTRCTSRPERPQGPVKYVVYQRF